MNSANQPPAPHRPTDDQLEERIVAWVLGEASDFEIAALQAAVAARPELAALLMDAETFAQHASAHAVPEPQGAEPPPPDTLSPEERALFAVLAKAERGRIEQEFLPVASVHAAVSAWRKHPRP